MAQVVSVETEEEGEDARYCIVGDETEVEIAEEPLRVRFFGGGFHWGVELLNGRFVVVLYIPYHRTTNPPTQPQTKPNATPTKTSARMTSGSTRSATTTSAAARSNSP